MGTNHSFIKTFLYSIVIITVIAVGVIGFFLISNKYSRFKEESVALRSDYIDSQKRLIKNETEKVIDYIEFKKSQAVKRLKQDIKYRTMEAHNIATNIYKEHQGEMELSAVKKIVIDALRPIRFNHQRGYYFATRLDGIEMLFADRPEMEGKNLLDMKDTQGKYVIKDMIDIARNQGEGFYRYTWTKPNELRKDFPKIAYIIHFKPFDWFIGTGEYMDDVVKDIQREVLERIETIKFGKDGYIFAGQWDGLSLSGPAKGKVMIGITDVNGIKIVQELIRTAKSGSGYVDYVIPKFDKSRTHSKISYTIGIPDWQWYVGAGVNVDEIETIISQNKSALKDTVKNDIITIIGVLTAILLFALLIVKYFSSKTIKSFNLFSEFFMKAATEASSIDHTQLHFTEFEKLAHSANRMIEERKKVEAALRRERDRAQMYLDVAGVMFVAINKKGSITLVNKKGCEILECEETEIIGKDWFDNFLPQEIRSEIRDIFQKLISGEIEPVEYVENYVTTKTGEKRIIAWNNTLLKNESGDIVGTFSSGEDITERQKAFDERSKLETQLRQAQKMEAIGTLAGGIAHDFNNILSAIIGYSEMTLFDVDQKSEANSSINQVLKAGHRAKDLVRQILAFSHQADLEQKPIQIQSIANEALKLLRASLPTTIEIRQDITREPSRILADVTQIHQVLMNLCTNAHHAMQEQGGVLEVRVENMILDPIDAGRLDVEPGSYVKLTVSDTGHGMDRVMVERIFDPYFTTKEKNVGTGLGLAMVHGIVKSHGGAISVESEPMKGSEFHIYFPRIKDEIIRETEAFEPILTGKESILFVDDEVTLTALARQLLEKLGYQVSIKSNPTEALEAFRTQPDAYDLVITDMTMPGLTGDKLAKEIMGIRPDLPIILCTGFSERISEKNAKAMGIKGFIMKPVDIRNLAKMIRDILDDKGP